MNLITIFYALKIEYDYIWSNFRGNTLNILLEHYLWRIIFCIRNIKLRTFLAIQVLASIITVPQATVIALSRRRSSLRSSSRRCPSRRSSSLITNLHKIISIIRVCFVCNLLIRAKLGLGVESVHRITYTQFFRRIFLYVFVITVKMSWILIQLFPFTS